MNFVWAGEVNSRVAWHMHGYPSWDRWVLWSCRGPSQESWGCE